jgi:uncharacterized protein Usg
VKDLLTIAELLKHNFNISVYGLTRAELSVVSNYLDQLGSTMLWGNIEFVPQQTKLQPSYKKWISKVDEILDNLFGFGVSNLSYYNWQGCWFANARPEEAVQEFLQLHCKDPDILSDLLAMYPHLDEVV